MPISFTNHSNKNTARSWDARKRFWFLILIMQAVGILVTGVVTYTLYRHNLEENKAMLVMSAASQARMIESIAEYNLKTAIAAKTEGARRVAMAATLEQVVEAHKKYSGFEETGEFNLARRVGGQISFILRHRRDVIEPKFTVPFDSDLAEPMRRALGGRSGTMVGKDHRGNQVLAAYESMAGLGLGIVAKIDLAEIRAPFVRASLLAAGIASVILLLATFLFLRVSNPVIAQIEEDSLRHGRLEHEYQLLFQQMPSAFALHEIICDAEGKPIDYRFLEVNPAFEEMTGLQAKKVIGKTVREIMPDIEYRWIEAYGKVALSGEPNSFEDYSADLGKYFEVRAFSPEKGQFACIFNETTVRRKLEAGRISLEKKVQQTQKLESLGVLAGGIAHDFNNLLMGLLGNVGLAQDKIPAKDPVQEELANIEASANRAADLAGQMLAFSGRGSFVVETVHLNELVREMAKLLEVSIPKKASLNYKLEDKLPGFEADPTQVRQVIMNLITNASEAIVEKNGIITFSTGVKSCDRHCLDTQGHPASIDPATKLAEGPYVYIEVTDTGSGMSPETIEKIFDPFYTTKFTGRGLGMSVVLGIIKGHKGTIRITSGPEQEGSTVRVMFPASQVADAVPAAVKKGGKDIKSPWKGSGTVLVADDEANVLKVCKAMLERTGFEVLTATDGNEAIDIFKEHRKGIDCVLLDQTMPGMTGMETYQLMRGIQPDVKVVITSGFNAGEIAAQDNDDVPAGFLHKPYRLLDLRAMMKKVLGA